MQKLNLTDQKKLLIV